MTLVALAIAAIGYLALPQPAAAGNACIHSWAVPGEYTVAGEFRGRVQRTTASLTRSCQVRINLPGVFTGGPVQASGSCVKFAFRVQGNNQTFVATWCEDHVTIPWEGRDVRASVYQTARQERESG